MNIVDDADGPLDPRIQIELENLNNATDDINKLEIELDEANTAYGQLQSESINRQKELRIKLGSNCTEKARCYFEACDVAHQARLKCQQQAALYKRAYVVHAAAKETVAIAETRFISHQHEWNFDQAWQDMLNHATQKVMEAEAQKAECAREHHKRTVLFHEAEKKVQQLEEKYRKSIQKAQPYFEMKSHYDQQLAIQKEVVDCLKKAVKDAKCSYAASLRALEEISNQIHEKRRDYDIIANGPREPGVGAELVTPDESLNYQDELNKVRISRVNSIASSDLDLEDRNQDFEDVKDLKQRVDHLSSRSVDGSESTSNQWELELQASVEKLNNLPFNVCESDKIDNVHKYNPKTAEVTKCTDKSNSIEQSDLSDNRKLNDLYQGWQSLTQNPINLLYRSKLALKNSISKSLTNSPVNMGAFTFGKSKSLDPQTANSQYNNSQGQSLQVINDNEIVDDPIDKTSTTKEQFEASNNQNQKLHEKDNTQQRHEPSGRNRNLELQLDKSVDDTQVQITPKAIHSLDSTPVRGKPMASSSFGNSLINSLSERVRRTPDVSQPNCSSSTVRELPLLSFFQKSTTLKPTIDKSCSMINLNEKQNLKSIMDKSSLANIQAASVEKLANARHKLVGDS